MGHHCASRNCCRQGAQQLPVDMRRDESGRRRLGRWFDAIAGLAGIYPTRHHEGEAVMKLEALSSPATSGSDGWHIDGPNLNLLLARRLAALRDPVEIARNWHATLATALADWLRHAMRATDIDTIAVCGGCRANLARMSGLRDALRDVRCTLLQARSRRATMHSAPARRGPQSSNYSPLLS
ncbi:Kae1-like domain-containing protein [Paraburkholderia sabiae]|uniref:Kae1-like domain-containing protein n=2 Tax=Paraburkholderia sabiae TaxID=273251 RepID=UPI003908A3C4